MRSRRSFQLSIVFGVTILLLASGCATKGQPGPTRVPTASTASVPSGEMGWWYVRFRIPWPEDAPPRWHVDVLLAAEVLAPVIEEHRAELSLWRFHRRAARDASGHQFSFIFYALPLHASRIYASIGSNPLLRELEARGEILEVVFDDFGTVRKPNLEDTSDPNWSITLQRSWPYYIMGVSELWLLLVTQVAESQAPDPPEDPAAMLDYYEKVDRTVQDFWRHEGGHALLHHLNAVFEYEPLLLDRRGFIRF